MAGPGNRTDTVFSILREMKEAHVFTEEEISLIPADRVDRFFSSEIGQRMLRSEEVHREWDFNLFLPDREMILQGMIDCAFLENGKWILLDFKTDRLAQEEAFVEVYRPQLAW